MPTISYAKAAHFESILRIWRLNRATLGLMPKDAFKDSISKKWVLIAEINSQVVAYLQFRFTARNQTISVVHLCVDTGSRGQGISELLLDRLVNDYRTSARGIKLNCRSDYDHAKAFWTRYNFQPKGKLPSRGNNPNIHLDVWWYNFGHGDLFSLQDSQKVKAILDCNIILKLRDSSAANENKDEVKQLQSDWLATEVQYFKTSETTSEIFRDEDSERKERSKEYLKNFPELNIDKSILRPIELQLMQFLPGTSDNDRSDRRQVAEAILSGFPYFVTLDEGILRQSANITVIAPLKILKPSALIAEIDLSVNAEDYYPNQLSGNNFSISKLRPDERSLIDAPFLNHALGEKKSAFKALIDELISSPTGCLQTIKEAGSIVSIIGYDEVEDMLTVPVLRTKQYALRQTIFLQNLNDLLRLAQRMGKNFISITDKYLTAIERELLTNVGFFPREGYYIRGIKSGLYLTNNLSTDLYSIFAKIPELEHFISSINSKSTFEGLTLEKLLWPLKVVDVDIPCFIIPIKPYYAKSLFDTKAARAELFGVQPSLIWSQENVYYRNPRPNVEKFPARILWYASADRSSLRQKAIVSSSYLNEVLVGPAKDLFAKHEKFGVYSWKRDILKLAKGEPENEIKVLKFSDSESFPQTIAIDKVKEILIKNGESDNNFQSPLRIKSTTFMELYALGNNLQ